MNLKMGFHYVKLISDTFFSKMDSYNTTNLLGDFDDNSTYMDKLDIKTNFNWYHLQIFPLHGRQDNVYTINPLNEYIATKMLRKEWKKYIDMISNNNKIHKTLNNAVIDMFKNKSYGELMKQKIKLSKLSEFNSDFYVLELPYRIYDMPCSITDFIVAIKNINIDRISLNHVDNVVPTYIKIINDKEYIMLNKLYLTCNSDKENKLFILINSSSVLELEITAVFGIACKELKECLMFNT
jgi:hypothetical protein